MTTAPDNAIRNRTITAAVLICVVGLFAYSTGLSGPLIFDDLHAIAANPTIRSLSPITTALKPPPDSAFASRPLVNLSFAIHYAISGLSVKPMHATNIAFHLLTTFVLFLFLRRTLRLTRVRERITVDADGIALACALIWEAHPLLTETVTYLSTRTEGLMALFFLLTFYCFVRSVQSPRPVRWRIATLAVFAIGCGCKEVIVTAPPLLFLFDVLFVTGTFRASLRRRWKFYLALAAATCIVPLLVITQASFRNKSGQGLELTTPWAYLVTQAGVIVHYLRLVFWPDALSINYTDWPLAKSVTDVLPQAIAIVILLLATFVGILRKNLWAFAGAWFFLILAPTSSILPLYTEIVAERRMYLPLAAIVTSLVLLIAWLMRGMKPKTAQSLAMLLCAITIGTLSILTWWRNSDYATAVLIWSDVTHKRPNNGNAYGALGDALLTENRPLDARVAYENAVRLKPWNAHFQFLLGSMLIGEGNLPPAIEHLREAVNIDRKFPEARTSLGIAYARSGDTAAAMREFRSALALDPKQVDALEGIADILAAQGDVPQALLHLGSALHLAPNDTELQRKYADLKARQGK